MNKIQKYIMDNLDIIYGISMLSPSYLIGGALRNLMKDKEHKDLEYVVQDKDISWIDMFLDKLKLSYTINKLGGYKINYNGKEIEF